MRRIHAKRTRRLTMLAAGLGLTAALLAAGGGCTYSRPAPIVIDPSYSYREASPSLTAEQIWPVTGPRAARASQPPSTGE